MYDGFVCFLLWMGVPGDQGVPGARRLVCVRMRDVGNCLVRVFLMCPLLALVVT